MEVPVALDKENKNPAYLLGRLFAVLEKAQTVSGVLKRKISWEEAAQAFRDAFQSELNLELEDGELTDREAHTARELIESQYSDPAWTRGDHLNRTS